MIAAAILAAGAGRRIGGPKALLPFGEQSFLEVILRRLYQSHLHRLYVVSGHQYQRIQSVIPEDISCILLKNPAPENGPLSSLQMAIQKMDATISGCLMVLVDHPLVETTTYRFLAEAAAVQPESIIIPVFNGQKGHPVYFGRPFFRQLLDAPLEQGARYVVHQNRQAIKHVPVQDPGILRDIDTKADYNRYIQPG